MQDVPPSQLDYELDDTVAADTPAQIRAITEPTRRQILDLVLERAVTVTELADALGKPKSSIAHHVDVLTNAGMLKVVRTRKVRAITERFYGRTGRTIIIGDNTLPSGARAATFLDEAAAEAPDDKTLLSTLRHARIPEERAAEFFAEISALAERFISSERSGDVMYSFVGAVYPTDHPVLADAVLTDAALASAAAEDPK